MMGRSSMPKQMMKKGGMAKKKMNMGGMAKMPMMQEGGDVDKVPTKEEFDAMTPKQQADRKKAAMMQNLNLTSKEKADKKAMEEKMGDKPKKMNMGGMAKASYSKGSKVRGYGMARGGKACKMR